MSAFLAIVAGAAVGGTVGRAFYAWLAHDGNPLYVAATVGGITGAGTGMWFCSLLLDRMGS